MKYLSYGISVLFLAALFSCKQSYYAQKVTPDTKTAEGVIYNLPQTELLVEVEVTETENHPAPFSRYAGKYFGNIEAITSNEITYRISDIRIKSKARTDPNAFFMLSAPGKRTPPVSLSPEGFLYGINKTNIPSKTDSSEQIDFFIEKHKERKISYAELALRSVREKTYDTIYREVFRDSVMVRVPEIRQKFVYKTPEKQAHELAEIIFLLRDDRNALLKGENDGDRIPDGDAMRIMINELNKLEKEYMSLFSGYRTYSIRTYFYKIIPQAKEGVYTLANFSEKHGVLPEGAGRGKALKLSFSDITQSVPAEYSPPEKGIAYRSPASTKVIIQLTDKILSEKQLFVNQFGKIIKLSGKFCPKSSIEFYPESGMLKSVRTK